MGIEGLHQEERGERYLHRTRLRNRNRYGAVDMVIHAPGPNRETKMEFKYDQKIDALAVSFAKNGRSARTVAVLEGVNFDFDARGRLITIEILDASTRVPAAALKKLPSAEEWLTLRAAAEESGELEADTLRSLINTGRIRGKKEGRDWKVTRAELYTYLDSRAPSGRPSPKRSSVKPRRRSSAALE